MRSHLISVLVGGMCLVFMSPTLPSNWCLQRVESGDFVGTFLDYMEQLAPHQPVGPHAADMQEEHHADEQARRRS